MASALSLNRSLETLDLMSNDVSEAGAMALSDAIEQYGSLTSLDLMGNSRTEGAAALTEAMEANDALTNLSLSQNLFQAQEKSAREITGRVDKASRNNHAKVAMESVL